MILVAAIAAQALLDFSGQGLPRSSNEDCLKAGKALAEKLKKKSFQSISTNCSHTTEDSGEFVPTIQAKHERAFHLEQSIGLRRADAEACKKDLKNLVAAAGAKDQILEQECIAAKEYDAKGEAKPFHQAWITRLVEGDF